MYLPSHFRQQLYLKFIKPVGTNTETYRREFITNIMIACLSIIALLTFLLSVRYQLFDIDSIDVASIIVNSLFLSILLVGWRLSRRGHYVVAASIVVGLLVLATLQLTLAYGFELPIALLLFALSSGVYHYRVTYLSFVHYRLCPSNQTVTSEFGLARPGLSNW
jgi:hypothetical protein